MSDSTRYAVCCTSCGDIVDKAWKAATADTHSSQTNEPLTKQGHVPLYCQKCGARKWQVPATKDQLEKYDETKRREARAIQLCARDDFEGMFKIPDDIKANAEIKRALANLLGPLDGETLKNAQQNVQRVARSGMSGDSLQWIDWYDKAVQKAMTGASPNKAKSAA